MSKTISIYKLREKVLGKCLRFFFPHKQEWSKLEISNCYRIRTVGVCVEAPGYSITVKDEDLKKMLSREGLFLRGTNNSNPMRIHIF